MALPLKNETKLTVSTFCHVFGQNWVGFFCQTKRSLLCSSCICASETLNSGFHRGGCYYICKQSWFGVLFTLGQSIQLCPKQRLSKRNPSCSPVRCSDCLHVPVAPQCPLSRADVQWVVLVRVPLWVDSLFKVWFNVKHEWVFDLVSRAEITAHSFVQPLHQCFCFSLTSIFFKGNCIC